MELPCKTGLFKRYYCLSIADRLYVNYQKIIVPNGYSKALVEQSVTLHKLLKKTIRTM